MADITFDRYINQMTRVKLPVDARNRILDAIATQRQAASPPATSRTVGVITRRILAIAACGGALFVGTAALSAAGVLPRDLPVIGNALSALGLTEGVPFALAAYADGTPMAGATNIVESNELIRSVDIGSWSTREAPEGSDTPVVDTSWNLNLSTVGSDVKSLDVSLPNGAKDMKLSYMERKNGLFEMIGEALTFNPTRINANSMQLNFTLPLEGALAELDDAIGAQATSEAWDAFGDEVAYRAALRLSETPITLTATLSDGSTVSHTYRISPVDNFKELYRADNERFWASGLDGNEFESTPLFLIEQLS